MSTRASSFLSVIVVGGALAGCSAVPEASGHCEGLVGAHTVDHDVIVDDTYFYRLDYDGGLEEAQVEMAFGDETTLALTLSMRLADMPEDRYQGAHALGADGVADDGFVAALDVVDPFDAPPIANGSYTLDTASLDELTGALVLVFTDESTITCETTIPRDRDRDTDD